MRLHDWETLLRPYLANIELLGEIPLDQGQHADLERALGEFVREHGLTEATRRLKEEYPAAFVTYLAFKAAFNDERAFWDKVAQMAGLESSRPLFHPAHHWGQTFLEIIESHPNLRRFRGVSGLEYVTPIRLHGGIPAFSLPDFFRHILLPSVEKAPYDGMDDQAALKALLGHYTAQLFVDDVVRYFFQYTGEAGRKFFHKCRQMARRARTGQPLPAPDDLGLRPYVVQAFENFQVNQSPPAQRRRRPRLYFDPYAPGFRVILPPQPLSLEQAGQRYEARIYDAETGKVYTAHTRLRPRRQGQEWFLEEVTWILEERLQAAQAGLFVQDAAEPLYVYPLRLLPPPGYPPLLAFRYDDERQVNLTPALPAQSLWLLYPADAELAFDGEARLLQSLPPFAPPWDDWQASAWDLSAVSGVMRLSANVCCVCCATGKTFARPSPSRVRSNRFSCLRVCPLTSWRWTTSRSIPPRRACACPCVIPKPRRKNSPPGPCAWNRATPPRRKANGAPAPANCPISSRETKPTSRSNPGWAQRPLARITLFWNSAGVRSANYRSAPAPVCGWRACSPTTCPQTMARGKSPSPSPCPNRLGCRRKTTPAYRPRCRANASRSPSRVRLLRQICASTFLLLPKPSRFRCGLPCRACALSKGAALEWSHHPISRPLAELLQSDLVSHRPRLRLELPLTGAEKPLIALHLAAPGGERPLQTSESRALSGHWLEFDLSAFFDTLRAHPEESVFEFQLEWLDAEREAKLLLPVLRLSRRIDIRLCHFEATSSGGWRLHWYEPRPLRHRRLWLWSRWQPWADPLEIRLPDDAPRSDAVPDEGWWMYDIPADISLPPSEYRAQFVVVSPYEHNPPPPFPPENAIEIPMITPDARRRQINHELTSASPSRAFALHFEKLCIYHGQGNYDAQQEEIKWCLARWREASLLHLEALARWLEKYEADENRRAFLMHMFREETLERLKQEHHPPAFVQKYLRNVLGTRTIRPESARRVIALSSDPEVILCALRILLQSDEEESRCIFWDLLQQGKFSEADAAALLKDHPEFARHLLRDAPPSPGRSRLLRELAHHLDLPEYLVRVGYFVLFDVGWGKILEIRGAAREDCFFNGEEQPTLLVELLHWPEQKAEIDLKNRRITLPGRAGVNSCACGRFAALGGAATRAQWQEHQKFCSRNETTPLPASFPMVSPPVYRAHPPQNPLDTRSGD